MTRHSIDNNGVEIAFDEAGEGRTIVWLHGMGEDRASWDPVTDLLAGAFRCVRIDFRGHGASTRLPHYEGAELVTDLRVVVDATCDAPPLVVGHSLGGMIATAGAALAITGPVVNIDQPLKLGGLAEVIRPLAGRLRDPGTYAAALHEVKVALGMDLVPEPTHAALERKGPPSDQNIVLDLWEPMLDGDAETLQANDDGFESILGRITQPYLAVHGLPVESGYEEWLTATIATTAFEHWDGLGHWLHLVEPTRFANRIRTFAGAHPELET